MADVSKININGSIKNIKDTTARKVMTGATSTDAGTQGQVPVPAAGDQGKFLRGDGKWAATPQTITGVKGNSESSYRTGNVNLTAANIGAATSGHTHATTLASDTGTSTVSLAANTKYKLTAGGNSVIFTTPADSDTKNTAGATDSSSKLFLIGATSQATNPQTYSHDTAYVGTDGCLYSGGAKVLTSHQDISGKMDASLKGAANGVAELDASGKVPSSQLPSYVDDVLEYENLSSFPTTGEAGKIYVAKDTNKTYRWTGSTYASTNEGLALGETSSTAYRGDRGKVAYDHSQSTHARTDATKTEASSTNGNIKINGTETTVYTHPGSGTNPHGTTKSDVGLGNVGNFKAVSTVASQGLTDTEKSNARANIGAGTSSLAIGTTASTAAAGNHTHTTSLATDSGTSTVSLAANTKYKLTAGGNSIIFTTPPDNNTTYSSKSAASGGTDVSLVTTGEKYIWNNKTSNTGTVTKVSTGAGLTGGDVTTTGTIKANLLSENKLTNASVAATETANRVYPVALDKDGKLAVNVPWTDTNTQTITGVKGNSESSYRTGNVNLTAANIGAATSGHTHTTSLAADSGTSTVSLAANTKYKLTAGGNSVIFTTPPDNNTTYSSKSAASGGTDVSLCTTGEKYIWNNKSNLALGTSSSTAYRGDYGNSAYAHASAKGSAFSSGLYKITTNSEGHVTGATAVTKADITGLGIPGSDTWRGIQNNLTSDSTTDSLSAAQGKALANGSARDSTKLPAIIGYYGSDNAGTNGWYKVCTVSQSGYSDFAINLLFTQGYSRQATGLLHVHTRCDNGTAINVQTLKWMYRYGFSAGDVKLVTGNNTWSLYVQQTNERYGRIQVQVISKMGTSGDTTFTLANNTTKESATPGGTAATDGGIVAYANDAGTVNGKTVAVNVPADAKFTDTNTLNTAGSTDTSSKIFLIGATSQAANPQTYSHDTAYVGTDGCLYSGGSKVLTSHQDISGKVTGPSSATDSHVAIYNGTTGKVIKDSGFTIGKSVPSNAVFTDTNNAVAQTATSTNADYEVLFSNTADNTTRTESARKNSNLKFNPSTGNLQATQLNGVTIGSSPKFTDTTYSSKSAASGGSDVSLVTTGEKYTWNNKSNLALGTSATTAAKGNHTHTTSLATDTGNATITLAHNTTYKLTAGGTSVIFKTPPAVAASVSGTTLTIGG